ncbi:Hypothetical protein PHPALM_17935 [Phytophthora palmivora]|uniref:PiggyBac transposable element-derived protein domain-containing protein n=1 Tax=Phytophthora palmivora TaxID=4796 RepID=A0A2P4XL70_9STRA|nr:Hypothetical protein PHPALM_17935 [Phytophthora palmivora]
MTSTINLNVKQVGSVAVPCPDAVNDYQRWMGEVNVHDLRYLHKFLLQTSTRFTKNNSLFLRFVDLALVNSYISHKETARLVSTTAISRGEWLSVLQNQLLQLKEESLRGCDATLQQPVKQGASVRLKHTAEQSEDRVTETGERKKTRRELHLHGGNADDEGENGSDSDQE